MKKSYNMKTIVVIFLVLFALFLAGCTASNDYIYTEISASEDGQVVTLTSADGTEVEKYLYVGMVGGATLYGDVFLFEHAILYEDGSIGDVYTPTDAEDVLYVDVYGDVFCYVKADRAEPLIELEKFLAGQVSRVSFANTMKLTERVLTASEVERFLSAPSSENLVEVDVRNLKNALYYEVLGYDSYLVLTQKMGAIFQLEGKYLFVDFSTLDNSAFDANGDLSYRKGVIEAEVLSGDKLNILETLGGRQKFIEQNIEYETGLYVGEDVEEEDSLSVSIALTAIFNLIVPVIPAVYLVRFLVKRRRTLTETGKKLPIPIPILMMLVGAMLWILSGISLICILASVS